VLGPISGGLECLDLTYAAVAKLFRQLVAFQGGTSLLEKLPTAQAADGRTRLFYRCPQPARGYTRLAQFEAPSQPGTVRLRLLAFVHGEGSWTVLPGSPASCCEFEEVYEWVGRDLTQAPSITEDERQLLLESAGYADMKSRLEAAAAPGSTFRHTARELLALAAWRSGDTVAAKRWFDVVLTDIRTPPGTRTRIEMLIALVAAGGSS
jgi:hypothetical protein